MDFRLILRNYQQVTLIIRWPRNITNTSHVLDLRHAYMLSQTTRSKSQTFWEI